MRRLRALCLTTTLLPFLHAAAQSSQYDVVSVRPHDPADGISSFRGTSTSISFRNVSLNNLIANAYDVKIWLVSGLSGWATSTHWDVEAKMTEPPAHPLTRAENTALLKSVLQQRFGLVVHEEKRVLPVLEMTVMPNAAHLKPTPLGPPNDDGTPARPKGGYRAGQGTLEGTINMASLVGTLSYQFEKTVVDKTGLTGFYDVKLRWTDGMSTTDNGTGDTPPALMEALQQQLGLKLTPTKAELPTIVVDSVKQPEAN